MWLENYKTNLNAPQISQVVSHMVHKDFNCFVSSLTTSVDLMHFSQAVQHSHWVQAMNVELEALECNGTWEIVALPAHKKAIGSKWLFKTKYKPDGIFDRYKSRLVVLGCKQQFGVDYMETFAPAVKLSIVRALLALTAV